MTSNPDRAAATAVWWYVCNSRRQVSPTFSSRLPGVVSNRRPLCARSPGPVGSPRSSQAAGSFDRKSSIPTSNQRSPIAARRSRKAVAKAVFPELDAPLRITTRPHGGTAKRYLPPTSTIPAPGHQCARDGQPGCSLTASSLRCVLRNQGSDELNQSIPRTLGSLHPDARCYEHAVARHPDRCHVAPRSWDCGEREEAPTSSGSTAERCSSEGPRPGCARGHRPSSCGPARQAGAALRGPGDHLLTGGVDDERCR